MAREQGGPGLNQRRGIFWKLGGLLAGRLTGAFGVRCYPRLCLFAAQKKAPTQWPGLFKAVKPQYGDILFVCSLTSKLFLLRIHIFRNN